jgi:hypothetical protein
MRKVFFIGLALTGVGAYLYYKRQVNLLKKMSFSVKNVKILEKSPELWKSEITLLVKNDSEISFTLTRWNFDILINNEQVTKISDNNQKILVQANGGVTPLTFIVDFSPKKFGLLDIVAQFLETRENTKITIDGNVSIYSGLLMTNKSPVNFTFQLKDFAKS